MNTEVTDGTVAGDGTVGRRATVAVRPDRLALLCGLLAGGLAALIWLLGWHGADLPAALHRIDLFRVAGWTLWDAEWFGGHYTLGYSVLFAPIGSLLGAGVLAVGCAAVSGWAFATLLRGHFGRQAWLGAVWFAVGMAAPVAIGQLAFLLGGTLALLALLAFAARRRFIAGVLGVLCPLASPVAAALLLLALAAWALAARGASRRAIITLALLAAAPIGILELLFPQGGHMPFAATTLLGVLVVSALGLWLLPAGERGLRVGAALYGLAGLALFVVPQPMGANLGRLGTAVGGPLAATVLWPRRRLLLGMVAIPLLIFQWVPAVGSVVKANPDPSKDQAFFQPLVGYLRSQGTQPSRVEIPPTQNHWEAVWAAADVALARGWERQVDIAENSIFYGSSPLNPTSYQDWLMANGVSWVALPKLTLDYSGQREADLLRQNVSYLRPAWHNANWQVWQVLGSPGLVDGPAQLMAIGPNRFDVMARQPGEVTIKIRYTPYWSVTKGDACVRSSTNGWTQLDIARPGELLVEAKLLPSGNHGCGH